MALPGYIKITAENQGLFEGECDLESGESYTVVYAINHTVKLPVDKYGICKLAVHPR